MSDVAAEIPASWYEFGLCLGIEYERLKAIEESNHNNHNRCFANIYSIWKKEIDTQVTWRAVIEVLEQRILNCNRLADKLRNKYSVELP